MGLLYRKAVYRLTKILRMLNAEDNFVSISKIARVIGCSERTVYHDITLLVDRWNAYLELDVSHTHLISRNVSHSNIQICYEEILSMSPKVQLMIEVFKQPALTLSHYAKVIGYSKQATRNILEEMDQELKGLKVGINIKSGRVEYSGDELDIRFHMTRIYALLPHIYDPMQLSASQKDGQSSFRTMYHNFTMQYFDILYEISNTRYHQGFKMLPSANHTLEEDQHFTLQRFNLVLQSLGETYQEEINKMYAVVAQSPFKDAFEHASEFRRIVTSVLWMSTLVHAYSEFRPPHIAFYMKNYEKTYGPNVAELRNALDPYLSNLSPYSEHLFEVLCYFISNAIPHIHVDKALNVLVISDVGNRHDHALQYFLERAFPHCTFYTYEHARIRLLPTFVDLESVCHEKSIDAIVSTATLPLPVSVPTVLVSNFLTGTDYGRLHDFLRSI